MMKGSEIPFRRSRRAQTTGSMIFDRQHDEHMRDANKSPEDMKIWSKGHFVRPQD